MIGEKGSLKNRIKEWKLKKEYINRKKEKELTEEQKIKQQLLTKEKKEQIETIQFFDKLKNSLKISFGLLFSVIENAFTRKSEKKESKEELIELDIPVTKEEENVEESKLDSEEIIVEIIEKKEEKQKEKSNEVTIEEKKVDKAKELIEEQRPVKIEESIEEQKTVKVDEKNLASTEKITEEKKLETKKEVEIVSEEKLEENLSKEKEIEVKNKTFVTVSIDEEQYVIEDILEDEVVKKVNELFLLEEVSKLSDNIDDIENRLVQNINAEITDEEKEQNINDLKNEVEILIAYYNETIAPRISDTIEEEKELNKNDNKSELRELLRKCNNALDEIKPEKESEFICIAETELETLKAIIDENLKEQKRDIDKLKMIFNEVELKYKRSTLVKGIHEFLTKTIDIGISLLPAAICKNKFVGMLVSTVVLNNRIKNMRKVIRKENSDIKYIKYKEIAKELNDKKMCVEKTKAVLSDSLYQIKNLKQEFLMEFYYDMDRYPETEDIMAEFSNIEYQLTSKSIELEEMLDTIDKVEEKSKKKIKVKEYS